MRDFNFFEPYLRKKDSLSKKQWILYTSISTIIIVLVAIPLINRSIIRRMENETTLVSAVVASPEIQEQRENTQNKQKRIQELKKYHETLESIELDIKEADIVNDLFLQTITDRVPEEVFFQNINISQGMIQITGVAKNNVSIAQFEENLRELPYFENVFIPNISANTGGYTFAISFNVKGGTIDETN